MRALWLTVALVACGEDFDHPAPHAAGAELHRVATEDGAEIALSRYATDGGEPVILCHGISSNHHFWDLAPGRSLALYLHHAGYDVWNLDLRGHGFARRRSDGSRQRAGWTVDDYGLYDLPAAIAHVHEVTGRTRVDYVGHSMGGMVLAVYLARIADPRIDAAVTVGSPLDFRDPPKTLEVALRTGIVAQLLPNIPTPVGAKMIAPLDDDMPLQLDRLLFNPDNLTREHRRETLRTVVSPLSRREVRQFVAVLHDGEFRSADGGIVYREALGHVQVPILFIAGRADALVNPDQVRTFYDAVGSPDKQLLIASAANGLSADYGHLDLGVGDQAEHDIYPRIEAWLASHPGAP